MQGFINREPVVPDNKVLKFKNGFGTEAFFKRYIQFWIFFPVLLYKEKVFTGK